MAHPLVEQLRFTRAEWLRALRGTPDVDGLQRLGPMNSIGWIVAHLGWQEQRYFLTRAQGRTPLPSLDEIAPNGGPATTPPLGEMLKLWKQTTREVDPWLDSLTTKTLLVPLPPPGLSRTAGDAIRRVTYHYWFHIGEILAIRQMLGHEHLPEFVGAIEKRATYRPDLATDPTTVTKPLGEVPMSETWRLPEFILSDSGTPDLWVADGILTALPSPRAQRLPGRFALPGLVDAHRHLAMGGVGKGPRTLEETRAAWAGARNEGVALIRDLGAPKSVTLRLQPDDSMPLLQVAGRWLAPEGRFFPEYHDPVPPDQLVEAALEEVSRGAEWVKVTADWSAPELSYDASLVASLVAAAHGAGARVAVHTNWPGVAELVAAGVDSIEHGVALDEATLRIMAERGVSWTPTLTAFSQPPRPGIPESVRQRRLSRREHLISLVPIADRLGVRILAGTDGAGAMVDEVSKLVEFGLTPSRALRAATTDARAFLGMPAIDVGASADVVTYDLDPREDPSVLAHPAALLLRGRRVL